MSSEINENNAQVSIIETGITELTFIMDWELKPPLSGMDAAALLCNSNGSIPNSKGVVYFRYPTGPNESITHHEDRLGSSNEEAFLINLSDIPSEIQKIVFVASIWIDEVEDGQNFRLLNDAFISLINSKSKNEIVRFHLSECKFTETDTSIIFAELYREDGHWKFKTKGEGFAGTLSTLVEKYNNHL